MPKQYGVSFYMATTGVQIAIFWPKNIQNISVLLTTPRFEPFGQTKQPQKYFKDHEDEAR